MILAIDIGNTTTQFALFRGERIIHSWRIATGKTVSHAAVQKELKRAGVTGSALAGGILASVVPIKTAEIKHVFKKAIKKDLLVVGDKKIELGLKIDIEKPSQAGADRLVNAIAGRHYFGAPLIIIDFGTATTFDVVGKDGAYKGGAIAPGIRLSLASLHHKTAKLPLINLKKPKKAIGRTTEDAMESGIFWGYVGLIEGLVVKLRKELGIKAPTVATGGDAALFTRATDAIERHKNDLTMQGLRLVFERNVKQ